jgi:hypothetical protein
LSGEERNAYRILVGGDIWKIATWKIEKEMGNNIQMNLREMS